MGVNLEDLTKEDLDELMKQLRINNAVLVANPKSNAWDFAKNIKKYVKDEKGYDVPLEELRIKEFSGGEFRPQAVSNIRRKDVYFIQDSTEDPSRWWVQLQLIDDLFYKASAESTTLVIPDYLWGRQDTKDRPRVPVSAKKLASSFRHIDRVITMDMHAKQLQSFFDCKIDVLQSFPVMIRYLKSSEGIENPSGWIASSTDAGSAVMAENYYNLLGCHDMVLAYKKRDKTGKIEKILIAGDVEDRNVLVVDDMDASGETKIGIARELKRRGARELISVSTHGLFTKGTKDILESYDRVISTDTHNRYELVSEGIEVVHTYPLFGTAIFKAQTGESISELFEVKNNNNH